MFSQIHPVIRQPLACETVSGQQHIKKKRSLNYRQVNPVNDRDGDNLCENALEMACV